MNCIEALTQQCKVCEPCRMNSLIVEFDDLPEDEKYNFDWYEKNKHILLYCKTCDTYKILGS